MGINHDTVLSIDQYFSPPRSKSYPEKTLSSKYDNNTVIYYVLAVGVVALFLLAVFVPSRSIKENEETVVLASAPVNQSYATAYPESNGIQDSQNVERETRNSEDDAIRRPLHNENDGTLSGATSICFVIPFTGQYRDLGLQYGRPLKKALTEQAQTNGDIGVVVRSTDGNGPETRSHTYHCYSAHSVKKFFGYISEDESLETVMWGRREANDAIFISPTSITPLLKGIPNFFSIQPSPDILVEVLTDFISLSHTRKIIVAGQSSIHNDAFIHLLRSAKITFYEPMMYKANSLVSVDTTLRKIRNIRAVCKSCPILLLDGPRSIDLIRSVDDDFEASWILPYTTQYINDIQLNNNEIITFRYRPFHSENTEFLQPQKYLNVDEAVLQTSLEVLGTSSAPDGMGTYIVLLHSSLLSESKYLGLEHNWFPVFEYEVTPEGISRELLDDLIIDTDFVQKVLGVDSSKCSLVVRHISEQTGQLNSNNLEPIEALTVPIHRGAQIHVDCSDQHADFKCLPGEGFCYGVVQKHGLFHGNCSSEVEVSIEGSRSCSLLNNGPCYKGLFSCYLKDLCVRDERVNMKFTCDGNVLES